MHCLSKGFVNFRQCGGRGRRRAARTAWRSGRPGRSIGHEPSGSRLLVDGRCSDRHGGDRDRRLAGLEQRRGPAVRGAVERREAVLAEPPRKERAAERRAKLSEAVSKLQAWRSRGTALRGRRDGCGGGSPSNRAEQAAIDVLMVDPGAGEHLVRTGATVVCARGADGEDSQRAGDVDGTRPHEAGVIALARAVHAGALRAHPAGWQRGRSPSSSR